MKKDNHITEVIFRKLTSSNRILALFPYEASPEIGMVLSYMHIGQHGDAHYQHCLDISTLATEEEYSDLKQELENIGYNLKVLKRRNYDKYLGSHYKRRKQAWGF